jgi:hypothetical protein
MAPESPLARKQLASVLTAQNRTREAQIEFNNAHQLAARDSHATN